MQKLIASFLLFVTLFNAGYLAWPTFVFADDEDEEIEELNSKINEQRDKIQQLDQEIAEQQQKINQVTTQKKSLETEVRTLDASKSKIETNIKKTQTNITASELTLEKLAIEINKHEQSIQRNSAVVAQTMREMNRLDQTSFIETYLREETLSDTLGSIETNRLVRDSLRQKSNELRDLKVELADKMNLTEAQKSELVQLTKQLAGEQQAVVATKQQKDQLLTQTKNTESEYQRILQEKIAAKAAFEKAINDYEAQLNIIINRNNFPTEGTAVLGWPLDNITITQYFGSSEFAQKNPQIYGGRASHPGVDFAASIGTPVKATLSGTVTNTGNTDAIPGCYSWGKWILIKHDNGLTSLYAHLSVIGVEPGEAVNTGDIIGNSGNTGYSTGPHLHYTLYASEGVRVVPFTNIRSTTSCGGAVTPTAPPDAYLDPLDYLPK